MTDILTERDELGHHVIGNQPLQWWKFIFDAKSPTWTKYGAVAFVEGRTETEARTVAISAGQAEFPQSEILPIAIGLSTADAAQLYAAKKQRHAVWLENTQQGIPNDRATLDPARGQSDDPAQGIGSATQSSSSSSPLPRSTEPEAIRALERIRDEWQPIETAPKDGTMILVTGCNGSSLVIPSRWVRSDAFETGDPHWVGFAIGWRSIGEPTHWMPLPVPPSASGPSKERG